MLRDTNLTVTAFDWVPPMAQGLVRDLRVRWALEEAGVRYDIDLLAQGSQGDDENRKIQPFGQVPALRMDDTSMFESGAILWRIAQESDVLLPHGQQDEVLSWLFAALNSVEPPIIMIAVLDLFTPDKDAAKRVRPTVADMVESRLETLQHQMSGRDYLTGRFSVADLMMVTVLRGLRGSGIIEGFPDLEAYIDRCTARPAFERALRGQMEPFAANASRYGKERS